LESLARNLDAGGAALLEMAGEAPPVILVAAGRPPGELLDGLGGDLLAGVPPGRQGWTITGAMPVVGAFGSGGTAGVDGSPSTGRLLAVAVWGGPRRGPRQPWWDLLLELARRYLPDSSGVSSGRAFSGSGGRRPRLVSPEGYLRGSSPAAERLFFELAAVAPSDLPVLVVGETGVGKEGIARTVHLSSRRRQGAFVALNCAAIPSELLEAELFGIGKAVATGVNERRGRFQQAEGGTVFLDEIGEMSPALQAKLLRALQEGEVTPVGGKPVAIDVRVVAATNIRLAERIEQGAFRRDLYYRLAGCVLRVPPLAERRDDIPALVEHFLRRAVKESGQGVRGLTREALDRLVEHPWPGNIRQLQHVVRRLVLQAVHAQVLDGALVQEALAEDLAESGALGHDKTSGGLREELDLESLERRAVVEALERCDGNQTHAAKLLGISRTALYRRLAKHGLEADGGLSDPSGRLGS
jgi:DNA-binding NtrC family response regulator